MKVATPKQMNEIDNMTINRIGIPGIVLMENAALKVVDEVIKTLGTISGKRITLLAGKGNNGGDALAAARHLYNKGAEVKVYITYEKKQVVQDAGINLHALEQMGINLVELIGESQLDDLVHNLSICDLIVDGIFGTGLRGEIHGLVKNVIEAVNKAQRPVISIDIPSGICGSTGRILGCCIKADKTVTFAIPKTGLVIHPGCEHTGELVVADIGIPSKVIEDIGININLIDKSMVSGLIPVRPSESNKGDYGKVFIVSGSVGMTGSGCLAAGAALRTGAGLVYLGVPAKLSFIYDTVLTESITVPLEDDNTGYLSVKCINRILERIKLMDVVAAGPGLSVNNDIFEIVSAVVELSDVPLVLDADALNVLSMDVSILKKLKSKAVITPHPGEMARLSGISIKDVQNNRIEVAREFACRWNVVTVLKGARTIAAFPDGTIYINPTGNSGMATAGTGDVLAGIISGLIGQGVKPPHAAVAGVYLHGLAGDNAARIKGEHGLIASDLVNELPQTIKIMKMQSEKCIIQVSE